MRDWGEEDAVDILRNAETEARSRVVAFLRHVHKKCYSGRIKFMQSQEYLGEARVFVNYIYC